jgi:serine kinase of HPr protein (carbohydrate metabolism regulator)
VHANALVIRERGVLLRGASGAGKSALTLDLIAHALARGQFARLIGDDRVDVVNRNGRLIARPHPAIAGAIEARGIGLLRIPFERAAVISLVVDLLEANSYPERYPLEATATTEICGVTLPRLFENASGAAAKNKIYMFIHELVTN